MCEIMDKLMAESEEKGKIEGKIEERVEILRELHVVNQQIVEKLVERFHLTEETAWEYVYVGRLG